MMPRLLIWASEWDVGAMTRGKYEKESGLGSLLPAW